MGYFKVNRFGIIATNNTSANQCKEVGHKLYKYQVSVTVDERQMDERWFVIDHLEIHSATQAVFHRTMSSCEMMAKMVAEEVEEVCVKKGLTPIDIYVKLQPVVGKGENHGHFAFIEYSIKGVFP